MNNEEMLELAAKAANYEYPPPKDNPLGNRYIYPDGDSDSATYCEHRGLWIWHFYEGDDGDSAWWNPLNNDSDAFLLSVNLRMEISHNYPADDAKPWVIAATYSCFEGVVDFATEDQRISATRRAIVKCAAAIGGAMP